MEAQSPISLVSWNIQVGSESRLFGNNWSRRRAVLMHILLASDPDIICVQEALLGQLQFLEDALPTYVRVGMGRDDGKEKGEHCAILFRTSRFAAEESGTFWLSKTPDSPQNTWDGIFRRICTWVRLSDLATGEQFSVFNTHFPLNPLAQLRSAELVIEKMRTLCPEGKSLLTGDFNCDPKSASWSLFQTSGLTHAELLVKGGKQPSATYHVIGHPIACIDAVFLSEGMTVHKHCSLNQPVRGVWPSDHFGISVTFRLNDTEQSTESNRAR